MTHACIPVQVEDLSSQLSDLKGEHEAVLGESRKRESDIHDLVKAVRALTADAEMRCALDEREIEFLWAAPSHIYGQHGWRENNGSLSERTAYPAGNFKVKQGNYKMAVRHGTEGNAKDVLTQRKKWLNSITLGQREALAAEAAAIAAGGAMAGAPVRLPALDEYTKSGRPGSNGGMLEPAHALLGSYPATVGGGVGLPTKPFGGRHHRITEGTTI